MRLRCAMRQHDHRRPASIPTQTQQVRTHMALNLGPERAMPATNTPIVAVARRYWWVSALVLLLFALVAGAGYLTAPQTYIANQNLNVALIPAQALGDPGDAALAMSGAWAVAHAIASSEIVTTPAFADDVLTRTSAE